MNLKKKEIESLKYALKSFKGDVYIYESPVDEFGSGGGFNLLVIPLKKSSMEKTARDIQRRYTQKSKKKIDVTVYREDNIFCREVMKKAEKLEFA